MSDPKWQKLVIRTRKGFEGRLTTGASTEVLLDGQRITGATFVKFEVSAKKVAKVTIELLAEVEVEANVNLSGPVLKNTKGKTFVPYVLSQLGPVDPDQL